MYTLCVCMYVCMCARNVHTQESAEWNAMPNQQYDFEGSPDEIIEKVVHMHIFAHIYTETHTRIHILVHMCTHCVCMCMFVYV